VRTRSRSNDGGRQRGLNPRLVPSYFDFIKKLTGHVVELREAFLGYEPYAKESLDKLRSVTIERDENRVRTLVGDSAKVLRELLWSARQIREDEKKHIRAITYMLAQTFSAVNTTDDQLSGSAEYQLSHLKRVLNGESEVEPRVALAAAVRQLGQAFAEHSDARQKQNRKMDALVTTLKAELRDAKEQGRRDALTQLYNRGAFDEEIHLRLARLAAGLEGFGLVMIDVDKFKSVNDTYGHTNGDLVLRHVADTLVRACFRKDDFVARYGGEEFAIILHNIGREDLVNTANRVRERVAKSPVTLPSQQLTVTISCGVDVALEDDREEELVARADAALYEAKETGRNRVVAAPPRSGE
jgi:diguanylate cyclase